MITNIKRTLFLLLVISATTNSFRGTEASPSAGFLSKLFLTITIPVSACFIFNKLQVFINNLIKKDSERVMEILKTEFDRFNDPLMTTLQHTDNSFSYLKFNGADVCKHLFLDHFAAAWLNLFRNRHVPWKTRIWQAIVILRSQAKQDGLIICLRAIERRRRHETRLFATIENSGISRQ